MMMLMLFVLSLLLIASCVVVCQGLGIFSSSSTSTKKPFEYTSDYGVDVSFPIHHYQPDDSIFRDRYVKSMKGCYESASVAQCDGTERARMSMNMKQTATQHNYTEIGFKKLTLPEEVYKPLLEFFERNKDKQQPEAWQPGNTYVNHWESPTYMVSFEDRTLRGGFDLKAHLWKHVQPIIEEWTGHKLKPTSLYGIRVYRRGAVLATHVDRLPLVSSCIIQVAQDIDEPWPVEVYSHDGKAHNVTMKPGEMTLYESHTVLHGRPFPLNGTLYANVFVHYIPIDHDEMNTQDSRAAEEKRRNNAAASGGNSLSSLLGKVLGGSSDSKYAKNIGGHEQDNLDPQEIAKHVADVHQESRAKSVVTENSESQEAEEEESEAESEEEEESKAESEEEEDIEEPEDSSGSSGDDEDDNESEHGKTGDRRTSLHVAAGRGNLQKIMKMFNRGGTGWELLHVKDENGWMPIHEATRNGDLAVIKFLVKCGARLDTMTLQGGTPLWWARRLDVDPEIITYFESLGAPEFGEDL